MTLNSAKLILEKRELEAKAEFYHSMAHSLLTPLTRISTNIQTADRKPERAAELLGKSQEEIMRMSEMINAALDDGGD